MRARERASRQNHQPLPAHLDLSAQLTIRFIPRYEEFEARFSPCLREGVKKPAVEIGPISGLTNIMLYDMAELLANPGLPAALSARIAEEAK